MVHDRMPTPKEVRQAELFRKYHHIEFPKNTDYFRPGRNQLYTKRELEDREVKTELSAELIDNFITVDYIPIPFLRGIRDVSYGGNGTDIHDSRLQEGSIIGGYYRTVPLRGVKDEAVLPFLLLKTMMHIFVTQE